MNTNPYSINRLAYCGIIAEWEHYAGRDAAERINNCGTTNEFLRAVLRRSNGHFSVADRLTEGRIKCVSKKDELF